MTKVRSTGPRKMLERVAAATFLIGEEWHLRRTRAKFVLVLAGMCVYLAQFCPAQGTLPGTDLTRVVLQLPWSHRMQFAGYYMALAKGFYREVGLDVVIRDRQGEASPIENVVLGTADFGISSAVIANCLFGMPIMGLAAVSQHSPFVLLAAEGSGVRRLEDLRGRKIQVGNAYFPYELNVMLDTVGIPPEAVQCVPLLPQWDSGSGGPPDPVFCHIGGIPPALQNRGIPFVLFHPRDYGADTYGEILFTSRMLAKRHPKLVKAFREASLKGWAYAIEYLDETVEHVHAVYASSIPRDTLEREARTTRELVGEKTTVPLGFISPERWIQCLETLSRVRNLPYDAERASTSLFDSYLAARARRMQKVISVALLGTAAAVLLLGGLSCWLVRLVRHRTAELVRSHQEIERENDALKRAESQLRHQHNLALALTKATTLQACLDEATAPCLQIPGVDCCGILTVDFQRPELKTLVCKGVDDVAAAQFTLRALNSPQGASLARGEPCRLDKAAIHKHFPGLSREGVRALLIYPIRFNTDVTALLCLGSHQKDAPAEGWLETAAPIAHMLGGTIHRLFVLQQLAANEQALRESEKLFRTVAEGAFDGITLLDESGRYRYSNGSFASMAGYSVDELIGLHFSQLSCPEDRARIIKRFGRQMLGTSMRNEHETRMMRRDGAQLPILVSLHQVSWEGRAAYAVVYRDISERKRLETELLRIGEWERIRIGQELHDSIGQQLAGLGYLIGVLARRLAHEQSALEQDAREIADIAGTTHAQLREVVRSLLPLQEQDDLLAGLRRLCEFTRERQGVACELRVDGIGPQSIHPTTANHLFFLAQEAIANAIRHGNAWNIEIFLKLAAENGLITITDDGCGFDVDRARADGSGLRIMRYRADVLGGLFSIQRYKAGGMRVSCTFNLSAVDVTNGRVSAGRRRHHAE